MARSAGEDGPKAGTFRDHLLGLHRVLTLWGQPREVRLLGQFHNVYGNEYVDLQLFDRNGGRNALRQALGDEAERLGFAFCALPRTRFTQQVLELGAIPGKGLTLEAPDGGTMQVSARDAAIFTIVTLADTAEQWHSQQEEAFAANPWRHQPLPDAWASALWPGLLRPTSSALGLLSRLARPLAKLPEGVELPVPPIFEHSAVALYWQVVTRELPIATRDAAWQSLRAAVWHNPFVDHPRLLLAQLTLAEGDWAKVRAPAEAGLRLLMAWGAAWDKHIAWTGWAAWARILLQSAERQRWPETLGGLNELGPVRG
jgi:hypothetical protein